MKNLVKVFIYFIPCFTFAQIPVDTKNLAVTTQALVLEPDIIPDSEIYDIVINGSWKFSPLITFDDKNLSIPVKFLPANLLKSLESSVIEGKNELVVPRSMISKIDLESFQLTLNLSDSYFKEISIESNQENANSRLKLKPNSQPINAGFVNYAFNAPLDEIESIKGAFNFVWSSKQNWYINNGTTWDGKKNIRLNSTFRKIYKDDSILEIGDTTNQTISGLNSVNFLGARLSSSYFTKNESTLNTPILPISGFSVNPSKLDLYLNNQIVEKTEINSGKYELQHLLRQQGLGMAQAYTYDIIGNPVIIDLPFYGSNDIIRKGSSAYDLSFGTIRKNLGTESFSYSSFIANGLYKYGVRDNYTQDLFFQYTPNYQVVSAISHWVPKPSLGKFSVGLTQNSINQNFYSLAWERNTADFSLGANIQKSSLFCPGLQQQCFKNKSQVYFNTALPDKMGSLSFTYLNRENQIDRNQSLTAHWKKPITKNVSFYASVAKNKNEGSKNESYLSAYVGLNISLGKTISGNTSVTKGQNSNSFSQGFNFSENKEKPHYGYGAISYKYQDEQSFTLNYGANLDKFSYQIFGTKDKRNSAFNGTFAGSVSYVPDENFISFNKPIYDAITVVKVKDADANIPMTQRNTSIGQTTKKGLLIIPTSNSESQDRVEIDINKMPPNVTIESYTQDYYVPFSRANKVEFTIKSNPRLVRIKNITEGTMFNIGENYFVVGKDSESIIDTEGSATFDMPNQKTCIIDFVKEKTDYECK